MSRHLTTPESKYAVRPQGLTAFGCLVTLSCAVPRKEPTLPTAAKPTCPGLADDSDLLPDPPVAGAVWAFPDGGSLPIGSLAKDAIRDVIRGHITEIRSCYESALVGTRDLEGTVRGRFFIAPDGRVFIARVHPSTTACSSALHQCIVDRVIGWRFPEPDRGGAVIVSYPFIFRVGSPITPTTRPGPPDL